MRVYYLFFLFIFGLCLSSCGSPEKKASKIPKIIVSVGPQRYLVKKIADETVEVFVLVPPGASPHSYEPSPHQIAAAAFADIWFRIGEIFEARSIEVLRSHNPNIKIIDLRAGIDLLPLCCGHEHIHLDADAHDSHIWLSPSLLKQQATLIAETLTDLYPENKLLYTQNLEKTLMELDQLDREISERLENSPQRYILVSHPAFGYFCRDYRLNQLSIEIEGKDPTVKQLTTLLEEAKKEQIHFVFVQEQYNTKGAKLIAEELQAETISLDPYEEDVFENLRKIAVAFSQN